MTHSHGITSVLKATKQVNGKDQNSTPRHAKTPLPIFTKVNVKKLKSLKQCLTATRPTSHN